MALVKKEPKDLEEPCEEAKIMEREDVKEDENSSVSREYDRSQLPELLKVYYRWLFPYDKYFDWLQYGKEGILRCVCVCVCGKIYIYIEREREREREQVHVWTTVF